MFQQLSDNLVANATWFGASLLLAIIVWFVAAIQANPIEQRRPLSTEVQILIDDDRIITNNPRSTVQVLIRAQRSVLELLDAEDVTVTADLRDRDPGLYTVPLHVDIARPASADTQPAQITVALGQLVAELKPVNIVIDGLSPSFVTSEVEQTVIQAEVRGAADTVTASMFAQAVLDLSDLRSEATIERTLPLIAVGADGTALENVVIEPRTVTVTLDVTQREDVREVSVRPFILFNTLQENFEFRNLDDWQPRTVIISGPPDALAQLGDTVDTEPISLDGRSADFSVEVPLSLPQGDYIVLNGTGLITVDIAISEQVATVSVENIPVSVIGMNELHDVRISPETVSVVINGAESLMQELVTEDIQVVVDANSLQVGTIDVIPQVSIRQGQVSLDSVNVTLFPSRISVLVSELAVEDVDTPQPDATEGP